MTRGAIFDIKRFAVHDGPGIRVTVFLQGCPLDCWWCHNPEGLREAPPCAPDDRRNDRSMTPSDLVREVARDRLFMEESGGGVTFSGGEPLLQPDFLAEALAACRGEDLHTAIDTSGYAPGETFRGLAGKADLILFDLKLMDDRRHRALTGVSNRPILDNLQWLNDGGVHTIVRIPVIPGYNDGDDERNRMCDLLVTLSSIQEVHLLPFHRGADTKYTRMSRVNRMEGIEPPGAERMAALKADFERTGCTVRIGG